MKKTFLFLIFFSTEVWAQNYSNQGILTDIVDTDSKNFALELKPEIVNRIIAETQFEDTYRATSKSDKYKDFYGKFRLFTNAHIGKKVWINSFIIAERLDNSATVQNGDDRYFENTGAYIRELNINTNTKDYSLLAGKFGLNFGRAWRWDRGLWSYDIANNYRQNEKLGVSGVYRLGNAQRTGQYNFSLSTFTNDRKNLDNSILVNRDSAHKSDGKPGDTRSMASYNLGLNINFNFGDEEKLSYNFSHLNLATNKRNNPASKAADQKGFVLGMNYQYPVKENLALDLLLEYAEMKNLGGNSDISEQYLTANLITKLYQNWNILLGHATLAHNVIGQNNTDQSLSELSFGYDFDKTKLFDRLTLQTGYKLMRTNNHVTPQTQHVLGAMLRYYKYF